MHRAKLLDRRAIPLTTGNIPVATDVFLQRLEPYTLEALRRAVEQGLTPSGLDFTGDDDSIVILRFTRPRGGEAPLMVEERRRRETALARVMLLAVDIVLAGEPLGLESARDLFRELRHVYPELVDEFP